jgi:hypothetical protein
MRGKYERRKLCAHKYGSSRVPCTDAKGALLKLLASRTARSRERRTAATVARLLVLQCCPC